MKATTFFAFLLPSILMVLTVVWIVLIPLVMMLSSDPPHDDDLLYHLQPRVHYLESHLGQGKLVAELKWVVTSFLKYNIQESN